MIKALVGYSLSFTILLLVVQFSQEAILNELKINIRFKFWETNLFFAISSLVICLHFLIFSSLKKLQPQLGFIYLPTLFIKGILFFFVFKSSIFSLESLSVPERLNLLIPMLMFLGFEVFFVVKVLRKIRL